MKKKKKLFDNYEQLLLNCYGVPRGSAKNKELVLWKSFDNGEVLTQELYPKETFREYVVQSSVTEVPFEEYVVTEVQPGQKVTVETNGKDSGPTNGVHTKTERHSDNADKLAILDKIGEQEKSSRENINTIRSSL